MRYVLAVSGGVDSAVLLDLAARREILADADWPADFVVAHFDHGIRGAASRADAKFVRRLSARYKVEFVMGEGKLPTETSEETARAKRYEFLRSTAQTHCAKIVTAHHRDDLLETIVMNLIRGTSWRGLAPMRADVVRPLLDMTKFDIANYALEHGLTWVEDATNHSPRYFRNRVRGFLATWPEPKRRALLKLSQKQLNLSREVDQEISKAMNLSRYFLTMAPASVALEILRAATAGRLTRPQLKQVLLFARTSAPHKKLEFKNVKIAATKRTICVKMEG